MDRGAGESAGPWRLAARLAECLLAERERWALWVPAILGCGIGAYFSLTFEPPGWAGAVAVAAAALLLAAAMRWRPAWAIPAGCLVLASLGFALAQLQTWSAVAPVIEHRIGPVAVEGQVGALDPLPKGGRRLVIAPRRIGRLDAARLPALIRIRLSRGGDALMPGDFVTVHAILYPPPGPAMPGAYDFQRRAYFDRLGAVGFAVTPARRATPPPGEGPSSWRTVVEGVRAAMTARIMAALPGRTGGIAAAIITGEKHAIPEADAEAFRDAGLAHILVIAGLHMGMVAGLAFIGLRALLALIPAVALRFPTKKWAAGFALLVTFGYMLLSGATVSSRRSFVMTGLALLAVMIDRLPLSARSLAYAATAILVVTPFSLTGPSFQMSFAAVGALVAFYETFRGRISAWHRDAGVVGRGLLYLLGVTLTTVTCTVATAPFTIFHFNRIAIFSVAANILAVPITGSWVMPWAMVSCFLMPLGLEYWPLQAMGWGIDAIVAIAHGVTDLPGSVMILPAMPLWGLLAVTAGGLWLVIWQRRWRLLGLPPIVLGLCAFVLTRPPDLLVSDDAQLMAARAADGGYMLAGKRQRIDIETWTRRAATETTTSFPRRGSSADGRLACDDLGCLYRAHGQRVALPRLGRALIEDCRAADLVLYGEPSRRDCRGRAPIIDRFDVWRHGAYAIWLAPHGITVETVAGWRGARPWAPRPQREADNKAHPRPAAAPRAPPRRSAEGDRVASDQ